MKRQLLAGLLALGMMLCLLPGVALAVDSDFEIENGIVLTKYNGPGGNVIIPDGVIAIGDCAFCCCENLTSVSMPNSVTSIGKGAFQRCVNLTSVTMSDNISYIGEWAFENCDNLSEITLPNSVLCIQCAAFQNCRSLTSFTIPRQVAGIGESDLVGIPKNIFGGCEKLSEIKVDPNNKTYTAADGVLFTKSMTSLVEYPAGKSSSTYIVPDGVTSIGNGAFEDCSQLTSIIIPNSVTSIEPWAFCNCSKLVHINIPGNITSIEHGVFCGCSELTGITLPDSITSIGFESFYECSKLTSIVIPKGVTTLMEGAFRSCSNLTNIVIPDSVTTIGTDVCGRCTALKDVYYCGDPMQWKRIQILEPNDELFSANIHYNSIVPLFTDVPATEYYAKPVAWAVEQGITNGTSATTFSPNSTCTQGHILTFLWRAQDEPAPAGAVSGTEYYAKAMQWAKEQGLIGANLSPSAPCTRADVVTYLWKLAGSPNAKTSNFTDVPASCSQAVAWAVEKGVTNGTSATTFSPDSICTRGQIVTFLYRDRAN